MAISNIKAWISNPVDYEAGCALYEKYFNNQFRVFQLRLGESIENINFLLDALRDLVAEQDRKESKVVGVYTEPDYDSLPESVKALIAEFKSIHKTNAHRFDQLMHITSDLERGIMANTILDEDDRARALLDQIDHYKATKTLQISSENAATAGLTLAEVTDSINRVRSAISKLKAKGKSHAPESKQLEDLLRLKDVLI